MIGELLPYILLLLVLLSASAFFSGSEVAMFSLRRVDRQQMGESSSRSDRLVMRLLARPRSLIAIILIGNESVNVSLSAVIASMMPLLFPGESDFRMAIYATFCALPLLLFFGEITPKTIAIKTSVGWSRRAARPLWLFGLLVTPIRLVVRVIADLIGRPFGGTRKRQPRDLGEAEFKALVDAGSAEGQVDARERRLIHKVLEFGDKTAAQVMQPRKKIFALSYDLPMPRLIREVAGGGYSRVPIYQKSQDRVRGILYAKDLVVEGTGLSAPRRLQDLLHEPMFVPRTIPLERLFRMFKQRKIHVALVVNEYGKLVGLVTMEDLLEELFGEILDEREQLKASIKRTAGIRLHTEPFSIVEAVEAAAAIEAEEENR